MTAPPIARAADVVASGNYKTWLVEQPTVQRRSAYRQDLNAGRISDPAGFEHVVRWKLSELTREENLLELPKLRKQLRYDLAISGRSDVATAHDRIQALALEHLPPLVTDRGFHAGTRYNALLMLGELNAAEERFGSSATATPLPEVLPLLVAWLELSAADPTTPDIIPLGAMIGILRHAQFGIADQALRQRGLRAGLDLAGGQFPEHRSAEGHDWLRRRAIQLVAWLARPGVTPDDDEACVLVWQAIDDSSGSLKLQVEAALAFSLLAPRMSADGWDAAETLTKLTSLSGRVVRSEMAGRAAAPKFARAQSRRIVAARLGTLSHACRQLGVDVVALRRSPPPTELSSLSDLYGGLKAWINLATDPKLGSRQAASALAEVLPLLERPVNKGER